MYKPITLKNHTTVAKLLNAANLIILILGHDSMLQRNPKKTRASKKRNEEPKLARTRSYGTFKGY